MIAHETSYQVDGEVGRFTFTTHGIGKVETGRLHHLTSREFFPLLHARQWYQTRGFMEVALVQGVVEGSYRKTSARINRMRHQPEATPARRLCDTAEMEGQQILSYLDHRADQILEREGFRQDEPPPQVLVHLSGQKAGTQIQEAVEACDLSAKQKAEMAQNPVPYEAPDTQVYVTIDDVGVKAQKIHRQSVSTDRSPTSPKIASNVRVAADRPRL